MWVIPDGTISMERLDGETILINFDSGEYFSFRGSSADILWLIDSGTPRESWGAILESAFPRLVFDQTVEDQIEVFLLELERAGVTVQSEAEPSRHEVPLPSDYARTEWSPPNVQANDDLADLLVIDPIHDASEDGWPQTRPG